MIEHLPNKYLCEDSAQDPNPGIPLLLTIESVHGRGTSEYSVHPEDAAHNIEAERR